MSGYVKIDNSGSVVIGVTKLRILVILVSINGKVRLLQHCCNNCLGRMLSNLLLFQTT